MKQLNHTILLLGMMLLAVGCTLSLDEPVPDGGDDTLNGDGFSAPKTQQTEFGDVTYQFEEGVRVIDEKYVPYIIYCRNDTAMHHTEILFTKNIPGDLIPRRGEYIATTMSQLFQSTLCDEVDFVEESQGGYLMTSHVVPLHKVFKELDFSIDARIAGDYEESSEQSRSGGNTPKLKGYRLVPRHNTHSRGGEDSGEFSESLFSLAFWKGDESQLKEFETDPADYHDWKIDFDPPISTILFPSIREGGSATRSATRVGLASYQNVKLKFSLKNGFDLELSNDLVQTYSFRSEESDQWYAFPVIGSTGMTVPKDGILHENRWTKYDYAFPLPFPAVPSIGLDAYVAKLCVDFNFAFAFDQASKITGDKVFRYEGAQKTQFFKWNMKTDKNYETTVNRSKSLDVTDPRLRKDLSNTVFQYATRGYLHIDIGFTLGLATLDVSPLRINLDVSCTHKMTNDGSKAKPSTLKVKEPGYTEFTYEATDKSLDEWKGTLAVGISTDMKGGADLGDLADYYDWFKHAAVSMKWWEGSMVLWRIADSPYPVIEYQQTYTPSNYTYHGTVTLPHPGKIGWFSTKDDFVQGFDCLELLIFDENFNFIKRGKCTTNRVSINKRQYYDIKYGQEFGFDFTLDNTELPPLSKYFYVVPAYWTKGFFYETQIQPFFSKPLKYTTRSNSGQINGVETLWVENDDKYCKPGYCLDGIAMDADCLFNGSSPANVNVKVEFFDSDGRNVMSKDFQYAIGSAKGGKIKAIYLINHRIETVIDKAKVTLWYDDPYMQTSVDPSARKVILDEYEVIYDDNTEWWPVFDYADPSSWTKQGYRIGY